MNEDDFPPFWPDLPRLLGIALILAAVMVPIFYAVTQDSITNASVKRACIDARGNWSLNRCNFDPCEKPKESQ